MSKTIGVNYTEVTSGGSSKHTITERSFREAYEVPDDILTFEPKSRVSAWSYIRDTIGEDLSGSIELVSLPFDVSEGQIVFLLIGEYSTADSFRRDDNSRFDIVSGWKTPDGAEDARKLLRELTRRYTEREDISTYDCDIVLEGGTKFRYHAPWIGYFERLVSLRVAPFIVKGTQSGSFEEWYNTSRER